MGLLWSFLGYRCWIGDKMGLWGFLSLHACCWKLWGWLMDWILKQCYERRGLLSSMDGAHRQTLFPPLKTQSNRKFVHTLVK